MIGLLTWTFVPTRLLIVDTQHASGIQTVNMLMAFNTTFKAYLFFFISFKAALINIFG